MSKAAKVALAVVLIIVATGLVIRATRRPRPTPPKEILGIRARKIDEQTLEIVERSLGQWQQGGFKNGRGKNPETGQFTMVKIGKCGACDAEIPAPVVDLRALGVDPKDGTAIENAIMKQLRAAKCPKCGGSPGFGLGDAILTGTNRPTPQM